jgi:hypothetical protein
MHHLEEGSGEAREMLRLEEESGEVKERRHLEEESGEAREMHHLEEESGEVKERRHLEEESGEERIEPGNEYNTNDKGRYFQEQQQEFTELHVYFNSLYVFLYTCT